MSLESTDYAVAAVTSTLNDKEHDAARDKKTPNLESSFRRKQRALSSYAGSLGRRVGWVMVCTAVIVLCLIYTLRPPLLKTPHSNEDLVDQPLSIPRVVGVSVGAAIVAAILRVAIWS